MQLHTRAALTFSLSEPNVRRHHAERCLLSNPPLRGGAGFVFLALMRLTLAACGHTC